jgi:hypothetical protein
MPANQANTSGKTFSVDDGRRSTGEWPGGESKSVRDLYDQLMPELHGRGEATTDGRS